MTVASAPSFGRGVVGDWKVVVMFDVLVADDDEKDERLRVGGGVSV